MAKHPVITLSSGKQTGEAALDLKRFQYFLQVAEAGSVSRAAEIIGIAQPALSRQMRLLEEELEIALFIRNARGMALTDAGEELQARILAPLRQLKLALQDVRLHSPSRTTTVALGLMPSVASILAAPLLLHLQQAGVAIELKIVVASSATLHAKLRAAEIDMALLDDPPSDERIVMRDAFTEKMHLIGKSDSRACQSETIDFRVIAELPLIAPNKTHSLRETIEQHSAMTKTILNIAAEIDSLEASKELIHAGAGYAIFPSHLIRKEATGTLRASLIVNPKVTRRFKVVSRAECRKPRSILQVDRAMTEVLRTLSQSGAWAIQLME